MLRGRNLEKTFGVEKKYCKYLVKMYGLAAKNIQMGCSKDIFSTADVNTAGYVNQVLHGPDTAQQSLCQQRSQRQP